MPLTLILGAAGSGKTETCFDGIRQALAAPGSRQPLILLVPEQATHQTERATLERLGGSWRVQVLSFRRLAFRAFQDAGGAARPPITELGRKMVLRSILHRRRDELSYFGPLADRPGLLDHLSQTLRECRAYEQDPAALLEAAADLGRGRPRLALPAKLRDLALIMTELETHLEGRYTDPDQTLTRLAQRLPAARLARGARVWVDGFSGFTPQEYSVLAALLGLAEHVHVTLCFQADHRGVGSGLFEPTTDTRERLITLAIKAGHAVAEVPAKIPGENAAEFPGEVAVEIPGESAGSSPSAITGETPGEARARIPAAAGLPRFRLAPGIAHLEREFFAARPAVRPGPAPEVTLIRASGPRAEVAAIAREILRLCREERYRFRDVAVVVRDLDSYYPIISAVFGDHGIPAFVDRRRGVAYHSLVELVRGAVECVASNWPYEALFRFLKTDLAAVSRREADRLENVALQYGLRGHAAWTGEAWPGPDFLRESRNRATGPLARFHDRARGLRRVREFCAALYQLLENLGVPRRLEQWSAAAEAAGDLETAAEHLQVYDAVLDLLDQLVEALGDTQATAAEFLPLLESGLAGLQLGLVPPSLDQVVVGSLERSRHPELRAAFVAGAIEGAFPRPGEEGLVIDDAERTALANRGFDLGPTSRERLLSEPFAMYLALTRAAERLYISYPQGDSSARGQVPSVLWTRARELLPGCGFVEAGGEAGALDAVATVGQLAEWVAGELRYRGDLRCQVAAGGTPALPGAPDATEPTTPSKHVHEGLGAQGPMASSENLGDGPGAQEPATSGKPLHEGLGAPASCRPHEPMPPSDDAAALHHWLVADPHRRDIARHALSSLAYRNEAPPLPPDLAQALYGPELSVSASRLEKMASCPFQQYAHYALQLSERPIYRVEPVEIGRFLHGALEKFVADLRQQGIDLGQLPPAGRASRIATAVVAALLEHEGTALLSTGQSRRLVRKLERALDSAAGALAEHSRRGRFRPAALEVAFGVEKALPGVALEVAGGVEKTLPGIALEVAGGRRVAVRGRIDRVDAAAGDGGVRFLLVMDYKRGSKDLPLEHVAHGLDLQMPLYLAVATRHGAVLLGLRADSPELVVPGGMLYFPVQPGFASFDAPPEPEAAEAEALKSHKTHGLLHREAAEAGFFDMPSGYSQIVPLRLRKDGSIVESQSHVAPPDRLQALLDHALAQAATLGEAILDGRIDIAPFRLRDRSACTYCSFRAVCRFDPQAGERWRDLPRLDPEQAWDRIAGQNKGQNEGQSEGQNKGQNKGQSAGQTAGPVAGQETRAPAGNAEAGQVSWQNTVCGSREIGGVGSNPEVGA